MVSTHLKKICLSNWIISPNFRGENKYLLKPPPRTYIPFFFKWIYEFLIPRRRHQKFKKSASETPEINGRLVGSLVGQQHACGNGGVKSRDFFLRKPITLNKTNSSHLKIDLWKRGFLLETAIFRCYVSFREGNSYIYQYCYRILSFGQCTASKSNLHIWNSLKSAYHCHLGN